jgi:hypothetical protein
VRARRGAMRAACDETESQTTTEKGCSDLHGRAGSYLNLSEAAALDYRGGSFGVGAVGIEPTTSSV